MRKKKRVYPILILLVLAGCSVLLLLFTEPKPQYVSARDGRLDLSEWDGKSVLLLSGEWDFYWRRFLNENDLSHNPVPDLRAEIPSVWNKFTIDGKRLDGMGYATYSLHISGAEAGSPLALRVLPFSTAYELYINEKLTASSGKISASADGFVPQYTVQTVTFTPDRGEFDIIIHISNFVYAKGGAWYTIYFGNPEQINPISRIIFGRDFFVMSSLLLISAYCLFLFWLRQDRGYLLFLAICVIFFFRTAINGDYLINLVYPSVRFRTIISMDYITLYWLPALCVEMYRYIYPESLSRRIVRYLAAYAAVITALTLISPIHIFNHFIYLAELVAAAASIYGATKMFILTLKRKMEALFMFAGGSALTLCILHDVLGENNIFKTGYVEYSSFGFLILAIILLCMFSVRYDRSVREKESMLCALHEADEREQKLELQFLRSQIRPHFINNALNTIISISRTDADKSRKLLIEFSKYLRSCYSVQNLDDKVPIENELSSVRSYVALEQARFPDSLHVAFEIDSIFLMVPPLTLQPLVENAIVHGFKGKSGDGHVLIYVKDCVGFTKVGVTDDGAGIEPEFAAVLLSEERKGISVGIYNINHRMKKLYNTELHLESRPEGGTDAYIVIPKEAEACCEP